MGEAKRPGGEYEVNGVIVDANGNPTKGKVVGDENIVAAAEKPAAKSGAKRK